LEEGHAAYIDRLLASLKDDRVSLGQVDGVRDWLETNVEECSRATGLSVAGLRADLDQAYESAMSSAIVAARDPSVKAAAQDVHAFRKKVRTFPSWTAKVPDDLTITIEGVRGRSDLAWLSLCADAVRWERDEVDAAGLYMMCDRLRQLRGASRLPIAEVKRVLEAVGAAVLADTDAYVVNIIGNLYASDARCGEILRLSVLVANMMGWSNSTRPWTTFKKLSVLDCLGVGKDRIRYKALFEAGRGFQALPGVPRLAKFSVPSKPGTYMEYGARLRRSDLTFLQAYGAATGDFTLPSASSLPFVIVP
jgi:hypothetical protein